MQYTIKYKRLPVTASEAEIGSQRRKYRYCKPFLFHASFVLVYTTIYIALLWYTWKWNQSSICIPITSYYCISQIENTHHCVLIGPAPAAEYTSKHEVVTYNGSLLAPSQWRGPPSPKIDAAWDYITEQGSFSVTRLEVEKLGKDKRISVAIPERLGGGYLASLDVFHQLHCLDMLRRYTHLDYYKSTYDSFRESPEIVRIHLDHCIELLRTNLMCVADVSIITHRWVSHRSIPLPDFSNKHVCRNFETVVQWSKIHAVQGAQSLVKPAGLGDKEGLNELEELIKSGKGWGLAGGR